jgi:hypothetical protein
MKEENVITNEWLKDRGFEALTNVSYNAIEVSELVYLCVDLEHTRDDITGEVCTDVAIGMYCDIGSDIVSLELYTKKQLKELYKVITGSKLKKIKK